MTIAQVEDMDGQEIEEWKAHIARKPFTADMLDHVQAYIRQTIAEVMGGKSVAIEKLLLIDRKAKRRKKPEGKTFFTEPNS